MTAARVGVLLSAAVAAAAGGPAPPLWAAQFSVPVDQTITIKPYGTFANRFMYYYDAVNKVSRTDHSVGQMDEICHMVKGKQRSTEPCSMVVARDGWRYVLFPKERSCCKACNASAGCGIIARDWLDGGAYVGQKTVGGEVCDGWVKQGGEANFYFATADERRIPCEYYEGYPTFDKGNNTWRYDAAHYKEGPQDPALFAVPTSCTAMCELVPPS